MASHAPTSCLPRNSSLIGVGAGGLLCLVSCQLYLGTMGAGCRLRPHLRRITPWHRYPFRSTTATSPPTWTWTRSNPSRTTWTWRTKKSPRAAGWRGLPRLGGPRQDRQRRRSQDHQGPGGAHPGQFRRAGRYRHRRVLSWRARRHRGRGRRQRPAGAVRRQLAFGPRTRENAESRRGQALLHQRHLQIRHDHRAGRRLSAVPGRPRKDRSARTRPSSASSPPPMPRRAHCASSPRRKATQPWSSPTTSAGATPSSAPSACCPSPSPASTLTPCCKGPRMSPPPPTPRTSPKTPPTSTPPPATCCTARATPPRSSPPSSRACTTSPSGGSSSRARARARTTSPCSRPRWT